MLEKLDLFAGEIARFVLGELLGEDEDAIERRAQLVGYVREELGFVARGQRQLGDFFLQRKMGPLDLGVLPGHARWASDTMAWWVFFASERERFRGNASRELDHSTPVGLQFKNGS